MYVYVASAWWRDCDPFVSVIALDEKRCEELIQTLIQEEAERAADSDEDGNESADDYLDDIAWSGVHKEDLEGLKLKDGEEEDLILDGYVYPDA